jgi:hypothetical protein
MIIFYCPIGQKPNGGQKQIYKTVECLNNCGIDSYIFHEVKNYKLKWFDYSPQVKFINKIPRFCHVIIPEVSLLKINKKILRNNYSILVQNGYFIFHDCEDKKDFIKLKELYHNAEYIYCVSPDTAECVSEQFANLKKKILNFFPIIDFSIFSIEKKNYFLKKNIITIMPRKNPYLASNIIKYLNYRLPKNWKIQIINNVNEKEVAKILKISKIFINVPGPEGFPLPPLEAALSGNIVIGSTGNGAKVYWKFFKYPPIELGDVKQVCRNVLLAIKKNKFDNKSSSQDILITFLSNHLKLHQVISNNCKSLLKNIKKNNDIVYQSKNYFTIKFVSALKKFLHYMSNKNLFFNKIKTIINL